MRDTSSYLITIRHHSLPWEYMVVCIPMESKWWSQQVRSLAWFKERELKRAFPENASGTIWCKPSVDKYASVYFLPQDSIEHELELLRKDGVEDSAVARFDNIWEMYKHIGYDMKKRAYEDAPEV